LYNESNFFKTLTVYKQYLRLCCLYMEGRCYLSYFTHYIRSIGWVFHSLTALRDPS